MTVVIGLSCMIMAIPFLLRKLRHDSEKNSPYECGFEGEGKVRSEFDVQFYLVAILFIIFDLEVAFLFPWAVSLGKIGVIGFWSMMVFLALLTVGFIYEWKRGALEWK
ncbi:MAG: NADH-quinone oxidoreductase subunit A [Alphaproteobacteria bacterium RIFCSPLOWO2_01_FULL_40_26]|nr:MAG: NADH-quinone oxidoreductase subunit A [Alphaproteobacteria bacterium RIFCSPHIGHO2_02_FULL_40_34]OFW95224.1 MAG: NADH-quinone oxidoreductase subunit A [Alphaproteobacteria bacterium RIFCSPLOWO2_01_FULL_40_26]OFX10013.1 MAG: NADH-quinone oxidoreductase subunit A [Alphaproteobacteria bacterium RIFCSPLOWO2_02_FULL_40_19]OFX12366.1 MAG: NADH-quinone oxidoreductase subunit A [Alphaproteobacteria bacterium RIFCSPLOWO2_12_FULL_40_11]